MKRILFLYVLFIAVFSCASQTVTISFTGLYAPNQYAQLNAVTITNLTKGWQEMIFWPDTVFEMEVGVDVPDHNSTETWFLSQNTPNPFFGETEVSVNVPESKKTFLTIYDLNGKQITQFSDMLEKGIHHFKIQLATPQPYLLKVESGVLKSSIKMINNGVAASSTIVHTGEGGEPFQSLKYSSGQPFDIGDVMEFVGHATINGVDKESAHITQQQVESQSVMLRFYGEKTCMLAPGQIAGNNENTFSQGDTTYLVSVTDIDGNTYNTIRMGSQCWLAENLRTTHSPSTGSYIVNPLNQTGNSCTYSYTSKVAHWYNNDSANCLQKGYGLLYNWCAAVDTCESDTSEVATHSCPNPDTNPNPNSWDCVFAEPRQGICPEGWHLPSHEEWKTMTNYVGNQSEYQCNGNKKYIAKALASNSGWVSTGGACNVSSNQSTNNATRFNIFPAGFFATSFHNATCGADFWTSTPTTSYYGYSTDAWYLYLIINTSDVSHWYDYKYYGCSVRCVRNI